MTLGLRFGIAHADDRNEPGRAAAGPAIGAVDVGWSETGLNPLTRATGAIGHIPNRDKQIIARFAHRPQPPISCRVGTRETALPRFTRFTALRGRYSRRFPSFAEWRRAVAGGPMHRVRAEIHPEMLMAHRYVWQEKTP